MLKKVDRTNVQTSWQFIIQYLLTKKMFSFLLGGGGGGGGIGENPDGIPIEQHRLQTLNLAGKECWQV